MKHRIALGRCCCPEGECTSATCAEVSIAVELGSCNDCACAYPTVIRLPKTSGPIPTWEGSACESSCYAGEPPLLVVTVDESDLVTLTITVGAFTTIYQGQLDKTLCNASPALVASNDTACLFPPSVLIAFEDGPCSTECPCVLTPCEEMPDALTLRTWTMRIDFSNTANTPEGTQSGCDCSQNLAFYGLDCVWNVSYPSCTWYDTEFDVLGSCVSSAYYSACFTMECDESTGYRLVGSTTFGGDSPNDRQQTIYFDHVFAGAEVPIAQVISTLEAGVDIPHSSCVVDPPVGPQDCPDDFDNCLMCDWCTTDVRITKQP